MEQKIFFSLALALHCTIFSSQTIKETPKTGKTLQNVLSHSDGALTTPKSSLLTQLLRDNHFSQPIQSLRNQIASHDHRRASFKRMNMAQLIEQMEVKALFERLEDEAENKSTSFE